MHNFTHVKQENLGKTGLGFYADRMVEHDDLIGRLLKTVDDLRLSNNTIVIYTTNNGPMVLLPHWRALSSLTSRSIHSNAVRKE